MGMTEMGHLPVRLARFASATFAIADPLMHGTKRLSQYELTDRR
jgi:hypothetical protein